MRIVSDARDGTVERVASVHAVCGQFAVVLGDDVTRERQIFLTARTKLQATAAATALNVAATKEEPIKWLVSFLCKPDNRVGGRAAAAKRKAG